MKKWLVGLLAAGLCAASAWAASYSLVTSMADFGEGNYVITGEKAEGEEHAMLNQVDSGDFILQQTDAATIVDGVISDPDASVVWTVAKAEKGWTIYNEAAGGYVKFPGGTKNKATTETNVTDASTWTISFTEGVSTVDNVGTPGRKLQYNKSTPRFACYTSAQTPLKFYKEGTLTFSVVLDPPEDFDVVEGTEATVTATAKNAAGEVTYAWTVDGEAAETDGPELALPTSVLGGHEVVCVATDTGAEGVTAEASVKYTVNAAPQAYTLTIDSGIENGVVVVRDGETELESGAEVPEGTVLTAVAVPATRSYKVESLTVTGAVSGAIEVAEDGTFAMPGENVTVSATFAPWEGTVYALVESMDDFEAGADYLVVAFSEGNYTSAMKNEYVSGSTGRIAVDETISIVDGVVETEDDSLVWTIAAGTGEGTYTLYNAVAGKYVSAPSSASVNEALLVDDGTDDAAQWTIAIGTNSLATIGSFQEGKSLQRNSSAGNKYFANYKGGAKPYLFKKVGADVFSVVLDPAEDFDVIQDEEMSIYAQPKNAVGEVTYAWTVDGAAAETDGPVLPLSTGAVGGPHEVVCVATDAGAEGVTAEATVSYTVVAPPALYTVSIAEGIENGEVSINLDGTPVETPIELLEGTGITVVATPADGFKLEAITVNGTPIEGDIFVLAGDSVVGATFVESSTATATYTVESTSEVSVSGTVPEGSEAVYASTYGTKYQLVAGASMTLTLKGYEGATITGLTLSMKSNKSSGAGSLRAECGDAVIGAIADAPFSDGSWNGEYSQEYVDIEVPVTATVVDGDVVITLAASVKSLYCQSFTVEYEPGVPVFSVGFDKEDGFTVDEGTAESITASARNGEGEITYAWDSETPELNGSGPVLEIPGTLAPGAYAVTVTATDSADEPRTATADISFEVVAPAPPPADYTVSIADGIENGTVAISVGGEAVETPATLAEGTEVTVVAEPADGFALETITVNGESIEGTFFVVAGDSEVSATFAEVVDYATLPFLAEDTPFTGPWQNSRVAGVTVDGLGSDYTSGGERGGKFDSAGDWLQVKFEGTPDTLSYALKGNGTSADCVFEVQESATGGEDAWTTLATYTEDTALASSKTEFSHELSADTRFVRFVYVTKAAGNVALYDVYISSGGFAVGVDRNGFELEQGTAEVVMAEAKNGVEPYDYVWSSEIPELGGSGPELVIPGTLEPGEYAVTVTATDSSAEPQTATADVTFTVIAPVLRYLVTAADGIENGEVGISVDGEAVELPAELPAGTAITVVAMPAAGYRLAGITVNGEPIAGDTFVLEAAAEIAATFEARGDEFVKIADLDELEEGEYVITGAGTGGEYAMLAELSDGNKTYVKRREQAVEIENNAIAGPDASIVWTLAKVADGWTIHNDAIGYVGYVAGDNTAGAEEKASAKSTWTISESGGLFLARNTGNTGRYLLYNAGSPRFACYTGTSSSLKPLAFYKKAGAAVFGVRVDKTGFELAPGEGTTVTATAKNGAEPYSFVWTSETEALNGVEGPELAVPGTLEAGEYRATVTVTDSSAEPQTATAVVAFTVVAPPPVYTVTVAEGIENGTIEVDRTEAELGDTVTVTATPDENYKLVAILVNGAPIEGNTFVVAGDSEVSATFAEIVFYAITVDGDIEHGEIAADKEEAQDGETVTLTATPEEGWRLEAFLVDGARIEGNSFAMPANDVEVSAAFVERTYVEYALVENGEGFELGAEYLVVARKDGAFTSAMKGAEINGRIALDEVTIEEDGNIKTDDDTLVWTIQAGAGEGQVVLYNKASGKYAAGPASEGNNAQLVVDAGSALAQWTLDFSEAPAAKFISVAYPSRWMQRNGTANNKYFATYTGSQTTPSLYKKVGPPAFSVGFDKEDGFTVPFGTADSVTAAADNGVEPYAYVWTGDLEGEGATLAIPADLAAGDYSVTVTATDASETPQEATASISFTVAPVYSITIDPAIVGGTVVADKETAAEGETVTLTVTPDPDFVLVAIFVNGVEITETSFPMPAEDVVVSAGFAEVVDYVTLPFIDKDTPYPGPWKNAEIPGLTSEGLGSDYNDGSAKFDGTGDWMQVKFRGTPGMLSFGIKGNGVNEEDVSTFVVQESADGETWTSVAVFTSDDNLTNSRQDVSYTLSEDSQYVQFLYQEKVAGNVGIYDVYIGEAGEAQPTVTVTGETTLTLGGTFALELGLENYAGEYAWAWAPTTVGYVDPETATWWWTPTETQVGETEVTFSAMDGNRTIASETVTLTVVGEPAEPEVTLVDGETTVELGDYFILEFALSNYEGAFAWTADVGEIDADGYFTWTPTEPGEFPVVVSAVSGEETIASTTVTLTVTGEPPAPVPVEITAMEFDMGANLVTLTFTGDGAVVEGTDDLNGTWEPMEALIDNGTAIVGMTKPFIRIR